MIKSLNICSVKNNVRRLCFTILWPRSNTPSQSHKVFPLTFFFFQWHSQTHLLPVPSVGRVTCCFTSPASPPFFKATTSPFSACLHSLSLLRLLSLSQHICCSSPLILLFCVCPLLSYLNRLFLSACGDEPPPPPLVGGSLTTDSPVNVPFIRTYLLTSFITWLSVAFGPFCSSGSRAQCNMQQCIFFTGSAIWQELNACSAKCHYPENPLIGS